MASFPSASLGGEDPFEQVNVPETPSLLWALPPDALADFPPIAGSGAGAQQSADVLPSVPVPDLSHEHRRRKRQLVKAEQQVRREKLRSLSVAYVSHSNLSHKQLRSAPSGQHNSRKMTTSFVQNSYPGLE